MKRLAWALALALLPAGVSGGEKKDDVPFYRKYLVPGHPLDDQILEQESRVEASPEDANLRNDFGNLLAQRRFPEQAAEQYEMAMKLDESNFVSAYNLGLLRETEGKVAKAISAYKKSIARKPGFPQSHFRLGRLYERSGRVEQAVREYANAMRIDPGMRDPKRNPLVVDAELIYRASLTNYERDVAVTSMRNEAAFHEESRFRKMPVDRALSAQEMEEETEPEADAGREIGPADAAGAAAAFESAAPPSRPASRVAPSEAAPGAPGAVLGGRRPPARGSAPRTAPPGVAPAPVPSPAPDPSESVPEPTPTPAMPEEVEPS